MAELILIILAYLAIGYGLTILAAWHDTVVSEGVDEYSAGFIVCLIIGWPLASLVLVAIMVSDYIEDRNLKFPREKLSVVNPAKIGEKVAKRKEKHILVHGNGEVDG
jgi:hypothetical protein